LNTFYLVSSASPPSPLAPPPLISSSKKVEASTLPPDNIIPTTTPPPVTDGKKEQDDDDDDDDDDDIDDSNLPPAPPALTTPTQIALQGGLTSNSCEFLVLSNEERIKLLNNHKTLSYYIDSYDYHCGMLPLGYEKWSLSTMDMVDCFTCIDNVEERAKVTCIMEHIIYIYVYTNV
jgi:hypothetical protein